MQLKVVRGEVCCKVLLLEGTAWARGEGGANLNWPLNLEVWPQALGDFHRLGNLTPSSCHTRLKMGDSRWLGQTDTWDKILQSA